MYLKTKRTVISTFKKKDIDNDYLTWLNNKKNFKYSRHKKRKFTKKKTFQEFKNLNKNKNIKFLKFSINQKKIGTLILYLDYENLTMSLGILLGNEAYLGMGIAKEVCSKIVNYYLSIKNFNRIIIGTNIKNKGMKNICDSLGFKVYKEIHHMKKGKTIYYIKEKKNILGVVCKDPGAANLILHYINKKKDNFYYIYSTGQANLIFNNLKNRTNVIFCKKFLNLKKNVSQVIIGTGNSSFEKKCLYELKKIKIRCMSVVDHITAIKKRFIFRNKMIIPDIIWTFDKNIFKETKKSIDTKVILKKNFYLHFLKKKLSSNKRKGGLLYLCEPHKINKDKRRYDFESLNYFFSFLKQKKIFKLPIYLKLHPKENKKRYNSLLTRYKKNFKIKILEKNSLLDSFKMCKFVFGLNSYALNLAADLDIPTFRCSVKNQKINLFQNQKIKKFHSFFKNGKFDHQ